ncbi:ATP-binding cassette transporter [Selaginella moellendorffii]|uniref:ATP-binding cassette transporter n=1 Tax=Selaginella moellendorffii TaxID=88036 RepID=D8T613_SELML|nr:ATP-binding cassette transporter [Selaginella moellendorffii]
MEATNLSSSKGDDHEGFLLKLRSRLDNVGVELPEVEVRFHGLELSVDVYTRSSRAISSIANSFVNTVQSFLSLLHVLPSNKQSINILHSVDGVVRPSRLTLLLGPPASGKTSLLLALASKIQCKGEVTYNGCTRDEFALRNEIAYISQRDLHLSELTVRETLNFAVRCQGAGHQGEIFKEVEKREKAAGIIPDPDVEAFMRAAAGDDAKPSIMCEYMIQVLGMDTCADTIVGNALQRGISGGQKRRLTAGEVLAGPARILFMDEISTGLDSSTTYRMISFLQQTVKALSKTMLISLLQPPPEVFELFDDLILLAEGHIVYHGTREGVLQFLEAQGFKCPARKGVADYLQEVVSRKDQKGYWCGDKEAYRFVSGKDFAAAFQRYRADEFTLKDLKKVYPAGKKEPKMSSWKLFLACCSREIILIKRNLYVHVTSNVIQGSIIAVIVSTIFLRTTMHHETVQDANKFMGVLFYMIMNIMYRGLPEMTLTITRLQAFYKQRDSQFYPAWSWALPTIFFRIPMSFMDVAIWTCITYWGVGFAPEFTRFFKHFVLLFLVNQASFAMFRCIGAIARSPTITSTFGFFFFITTVANGGYLKSRGTSCKKTKVGEVLLKTRGMFPNPEWYWIGLAGLVISTLVFNALYVLALTYLNRLVTALRKPCTAIYSNSSEATARKKAEDIEDGGVGEVLLPSLPLSLAFRNIVYEVNLDKKSHPKSDTKRLQLLHNVSGALRPGVLTALIGVTGAGKTTLFDVLAGRKTVGYVRGELSVSGYPKNHKTFARVSGYCEQVDIHSPHVTVYESLVFSAWLRLPQDVNHETVLRFVEEVMELVELDSIRNVSVGVPGVSGLSTEQRKRLTIAVELVANPSILFIDEPTSGLDARAAAIVMRAIRNTVNSSRTVICTIHQPSIDIFESFDELFLMKRGGQLIYAGPLGKESCHLIEYFEAIPGIPKIKDGQNPATWVMEATTQSKEELLGINLVEIYENSPLYGRNQNLIRAISVPAPQSQDLHFRTTYSKPFLEQFYTCLWKQHRSYWRNPIYFYSRMFYGVVVGFLLGTMFWNSGKELKTEQDIFNLLGAMYTSTIYVGISDSISVQPQVIMEREVFYREVAAGMYSPHAFALSQVIIEVPYILLQAASQSLLIYLLVGLQWTPAKFFYFVFFIFGSCLNYTLFGMLGVAMTSNFQMAVLTQGALVPWNIFSGIIIPLAKIPPWWRWCSWLCPPTWTLYGLLASQLGDVETPIEVPGQSKSSSVKNFIRDYYGYQEEGLRFVVFMHIVFPAVFALAFTVLITYAKFQKK